MDYIRIYKQIIEKARGLESQRIDSNTYLEEHHIVPKCMGGLNIDSNLVHLTAREHFICHWLLFKKYRSSDIAHAFFSMINGPLTKNGKRNLQVNSRSFQSAREAQAWANNIQSLAYHNKIPHQDPATFDLPDEWIPLRVLPSHKGKTNLINRVTGVIRRFDVSQAKLLNDDLNNDGNTLPKELERFFANQIRKM